MRKSLWRNTFRDRDTRVWTEGAARVEYGVLALATVPMPQPTRRLALTLVVALITSACGALPPVEPAFPGSQPRATIVIDNFETGYIGVAVFITSMSGGNWRLGRISTAGSMSLPFPNMREGEYFLEARVTGQPGIRSEQFFLNDGDTIEWHLADNRISRRAP